MQAGAEATEYGVDRAEQDDWALRSQQRYADALARGCFADEIVPVDVPDRTGRPVRLAADEAPRPDTTAQRLAALPTVYDSATVTAGNAPNMSTGAVALVLASTAEATRRGTTGLATIGACTQVSGDPQRLASMPARAAQRALAKAGLTLDDIDLIEVNEAFAAVPLVTTLALADGDRGGALRLRERTNVNGGAVAVGHPTGATGGRLVMTMINELRRRGGGGAWSPSAAASARPSRSSSPSADFPALLNSSHRLAAARSRGAHGSTPPGGQSIRRKAATASCCIRRDTAASVTSAEPWKVAGYRCASVGTPAWASRWA